MHGRNLIGAIASTAALLLADGPGAQAFDAGEPYPDWKGQWIREAEPAFPRRHRPAV